MTCETCQFYSAYTATWGICHRYPPIRDREEKQCLQPEVKASDWCGEHSKLNTITITGPVK